MNKLRLLITVVGAFLMLTTNIMAQESVTATATGTATIVAPIAIEKTADMNFGNVAAGADGGTVVLSPAAGRTVTGTVQLAANAPGTVTAAGFDVTGEGVYTYAITVPTGNYEITHTNESDVMQISTFTATTTNGIGGSSPNYTSALVSSADAILVGATLTVATSQLAGVYTNATGFPVIVNYN